MGKVAVWARIPVQPGKRDEMVAAMQAGLESAQAEPGTLSYILHTAPDDADSLFMYEVYEDQDALAAHMGSEAFKALGPAIRPFLAGRPELKLVDPIGGKGL